MSMADPQDLPSFDAQSVLAALRMNDVDAALAAGLLHAPALDELLRLNLSEEDARSVDSAASRRRTALAARERFNQRNKRVAARKHARDTAHQNKLDQTSKLPPAANAALLRALARVKKPQQ